jgi:hypothetical protein
MALFDLGMYMARSMWGLSYAAASFLTMALTGVAIIGASTRYRRVNIILCVLSNHLSELPTTIMLMDAYFYTWLSVTRTFRKLATNFETKQVALPKNHTEKVANRRISLL